MILSSVENPPVIARVTRDWRFFVVLALACQFPLLQLLIGAQYGDAPRNYHWGLLTAEQPAFLLTAPDTYNFVNGFVPDPPTLAPAGFASDVNPRGLHVWWGPLYVLLLGGVWRLTGSYALLQLIIPLAAAAVVLLTYLVGRRFVGPDAALLGAALLALQPIFREHAIIGYVEPLSALVLSAALWLFITRRTWPAALFGCLAMYGKIDLIFIYLGTVCLTGWLERRRIPLRHTLICLLLPLVAIVPWLVLVYGVFRRPLSVTGGGMSLGILQVLLPLTLDQLFLLGREVALVGIALVGWLAWRGARRTNAPAEVTRMLVVWALLGVVVIVSYMATPGASNNPRVMIPAFAPIALLSGAGLISLGRRWRLVLVESLVLLLLLGNVTITLFQIVQGQLLRDVRPALAVLADAPRGVVLTDQYWPTILFARQPASGFEHDPVFQRNILWNAANFRRYLASTPIRYVLIPAEQEYSARVLASPAARLAQLLPGRELGIEPTPLVAPEVRAYLTQTYPVQQVGSYVIYTVR